MRGTTGKVRISHSKLMSRLKKEKQTWELILQQMNDKDPSHSQTTSSDKIDSSLVRPIEASFVRSLEAHHADIANSEGILKSAQSGELEFQIDRLHQSLHTVDTFTDVADKFGSRILEEAEKVLANVDKRAMKTAGTEGWDVQSLLRQVTRA
jgi:hypothetical protein